MVAGRVTDHGVGAMVPRRRAPGRRAVGRQRAYALSNPNPNPDPDPNPNPNPSPNPNPRRVRCAPSAAPPSVCNGRTLTLTLSLTFP
eukprot:scaffold3024_cov54-Phaeocystis_antarctica.AAC.2